MTSKRSNTSVRLAQRKQLTNSANKNWGDNTERPELTAGYVVGGVFKIVRRIGEGGMGVVYLAQHQSLGQQYALKVLSPEAVNQQNWLRFQAEAKILARLKHPTVVQVYDLGLHEKSIPFYSMDYLVGSTLEELLADKGSLPLGFTIEVFLAVLDGLSYAHGNNIIHRDIKPANIFICDSASNKLQVKILDFGISKLVDAGAKVQQLTAVGEIFGSPFYMSPEQCRGDKVDLRSDIYSVGCSLFEALTGFVPFEGKTSLDISLQHEEAEPPLICDVDESLAADLPESVDAVIAKCLAKQPEDRYQSADELALDLARIRDGKTVAPQVVAASPRPGLDGKKRKSKRTNHLPLLLGLASAVVLLGCAGLYVFLDSRYKVLQASPLLSSSSSSSSTSSTSSNASSAKSDSKLNVTTEAPLGALYAAAEPVDDELTAERRAMVEKFLASKPEFYSKVVAGPGGKGRLFSFPRSFSLGSITFVDKRGQNISRQAQGDLMMYAGTALRFSPGEVVKAYPDLLKYFRPDDVQSFYLDDVPSLSQDLLHNIVRLSALHHLAFNRLNLQAEHIAALNSLPKLGALDLRHCHIDGEILSKQKILRQLHSARFEGVKNVSPVLRVLTESKQITVLFLGGNTLSGAEIASLAAMTQLSDLSLVNCSITNDELAKLTGLQKLKRLNLDRCGRLDQGCLESLAKFQNLEMLILPDDLLTDGNEKFLAQRLPRLKHFK
jgi:serine/threonine protein kinase